MGGNPASKTLYVVVDRKCLHYMLWFAVGIGTDEISPTELIGINGTTTGGVFSPPVGSIDSLGLISLNTIRANRLFRSRDARLIGLE